jgi:hypothetical protein
MSRPRILIQLDADAHASVFDAVVAIDSGVDQLLSYSGVKPADVQALVHGAIFTRGMRDLASTAIFIGGSNVAEGEALLAKTLGSFFGPLRVSVMLDSNGANTTASAAVLAAARHLDLSGITAAVLAATGPVGQRAVRLLARSGAKVRVASRSQARAEEVCRAVAERVASAILMPCATADAAATAHVLDGADLVVAAGATGVELIADEVRKAARSLKVAIDLNAVPPAGIGGIAPGDTAAQHDGALCYGPIGMGGIKMKIHSACIERLFQANSQVLDAEEIFAIGRELEAGKR